MVTNKKLVFYILSSLVLFLPSVFYTQTSETFEFNKIILIYTTTILLLVISPPKLSFFKNKFWLTLALGLFLGSQIISTLFSIDLVTSLFGYYSRFNGGLLSTLSYLVIFLITVSHFDSKDLSRFLKLIAVGSIPVIVYGVLQKLGVHRELWVQDTTARVFSTLGQPNWLATYLVATAPIVWHLSVQNRRWLLLAIANLVTLFFTKSQSGLVAFVVTGLIYFYQPKITSKVFWIGLAGIIVCLIGFTIYIFQTPINLSDQNIPALKRAGTSSWQIRTIVWKGALSVFAKHPFIGTGPETFAFAYWQNRPVEQNLTSEWNFTYNKAHNEFLNYQANTGLFGLLGYLFLVTTLGFYLATSRNTFARPLLAGWVGINLANFFGFSTTASSLLFFLYPALVLCHSQPIKPGSRIKSGMTLIIFIPLFIFIARYWLADYYFAKATRNTQMGQPITALADINHSISYMPFFVDYWGKKADINSKIALLYYEAGDIKTALDFSQQAIDTINSAVGMAPHNVILARNRASLETTLSLINPKLIDQAIVSLTGAKELAPTDPKIYYHLGNLYYSQKKLNLAAVELEKAVKLKPDYKEARLTLAAVHESLGQKDEAKEEYQYILDFIAPHDLFIQNKLKSW